MEQKKIIIIGAGITGLCAGSYLQMNGYQTEIFELHNIPGGLCTAWKRKGYTMDGCVHWLLGSSPPNPFYYLWNELLDMKSLKFVDMETQFRFVARNGEVLNLYTDLNRLSKELLEKAPEDKKFIHKIIKAVRKLEKFEIPIQKPMELMSVMEKVGMISKMLPFMPTLLKYGKVSVADLGKKCQNPLLREAFTHNKQFNNFAFLGWLMSVAFYSSKCAGYPIGGSLPFARLFEQKYTELGGKIHFNKKVDKIIVESDSARGIVLVGGEKHEADMVISAADGHDTIYGMLDGRYTDEKIETRYQCRDKLLTPFPSLVYVSLGVARKFDHLPHQIVYQIDDPVKIDETMTHGCLNTTIYNFDSTLAPDGKTCVNVMFESFGYEYWTRLRESDPDKYKAEKQKIADRVVDLLEEKIGDFKKHVEVVDVATPATFIRYTNNWRGSYEGWMPGPGALSLTIKKKLPGLDNFYLIGQWVEPVPSGIRSGRNVTQMICKKDGKKFSAKQLS